MNEETFFVRWVPKILAEKQKLAALLTFLEDYDKYDNELLDRIVTDDETWMKYVNCEMKGSL